MNRLLWSALIDALAPQAALLTQTDQFVRQAAVMLLITDESEPQLLYTLRAQHLTYHAGEVCFPGGMWELQDATLLASAIRETQEEIGVPEAALQVLGALPIRTTLAGTRVTPFVACIPADFTFIPNHRELDVVFTVPLRQLMTSLQIRLDTFEHHNRQYQVPVYAFQGYEIWGFTAAVTAELLVLLGPILNR